MFTTLLLISVTTMIGVHALRFHIQPRYNELSIKRPKCLMNELKLRLQKEWGPNPEYETLANVIDLIWLENRHLILDVKASNFHSICKRSGILFAMSLLAFLIKSYPGITVPEWVEFLTMVLISALLSNIYFLIYVEIDYYIKVNNVIK